MPKVLTGINIQFPISELILSGEKTIETRTYPIPKQYEGIEMVFIETPGKKGKFKSRIVAIITFSHCYQYKTLQSFRDEEELHCVQKDSDWDWTAKKPKWAWVIEKIHLLPAKEFIGKKGIVYTKNIKI